MTSSADVGGPELTHAVGARDHVAGRADAPLTLVEYGDFECPQCGQAFPIIKDLQRAFGDRLRFVFRHFPLTSSHPHAQHAAEAAEWAAARGAFWPMHDLLFSEQRDLSERHILELARRLGLDPSSLPEAWAAHTYIARVKEDFLGGIRSGVAGTPTFFINGTGHQGPWDGEGLARALERAERAAAEAGGPDFLLR
jgi:protein-disulfide isomerase